jgi:hypothetical protein
MKHMLKTILLFFLLLNSIYLFGQKKYTVTKLKLENIPKEIKYSGKIIDAITWEDDLGKNLVMTCKTEATINLKSEMDGYDVEIYAYHYLLINNKPKFIWKIYDFISDCWTDHVAEFINNTLSVTDLNNDGIAEIWVMYLIACRGDVSPDEMKIIMYQGNQKYAMRGENKVNIPGYSSGGQYTFDKEFLKAPKAFKDYAIKLWKKNILQQ